MFITPRKSFGDDIAVYPEGSVIPSLERDLALDLARDVCEILAFPLRASDLKVHFVDFSHYGFAAKADASGVDLKVRVSDLEVHIRLG